MARRGPDVTVVGGGLAGLIATRVLAEGGATVALLEARDRVGGRTFSQVAGDAWLDLGAQWLDRTQGRMTKLTEELGIETFPTFHEGKKVLDTGGKISTYKSSIPSMAPHRLVVLQRAISQIDRMAKQVSRETPWTARKALEWDALSVGAWMADNVRSEAVRNVFAVGIRVVFGAEPSELSLLHCLQYVNAGGGLMRLVEIDNGAQETRFVQGSQWVALRLKEQLGERVTVGVPVRSIEQSRSDVVVRTDTGSLRSAFSIVAVPPALAGRIRYEPALPSLRAQLTQRWPMGATTKCHLLYDRPFWRDEGFSGEVVTTHGPLSVVFDNSPRDGDAGALLAFSVGRSALALGRRPEGERRRIVTEELARWFGPQAAAPTHYIDKDWAADPWSRGCPTGFGPPGVLTTYGPALRQPVGRIHWAGTETATEWSGYMEGAVESGERAAREVLSRL